MTFPIFQPLSSPSVVVGLVMEATLAAETEISVAGMVGTSTSVLIPDSEHEEQGARLRAGRIGTLSQRNVGTTGVALLVIEDVLSWMS